MLGIFNERFYFNTFFKKIKGQIAIFMLMLHNSCERHLPAIRSMTSLINKNLLSSVFVKNVSISSRMKTLDIFALYLSFFF